MKKFMFLSLLFIFVGGMPAHAQALKQVGEKQVSKSDPVVVIIGNVDGVNKTVLLLNESAKRLTGFSNPQKRTNMLNALKKMDGIDRVYWQRSGVVTIFKKSTASWEQAITQSLAVLAYNNKRKPLYFSDFFADLASALGVSKELAIQLWISDTTSSLSGSSEAGPYSTTLTYIATGTY